jgi:oligopeptidase B
MDHDDDVIYWKGDIAMFHKSILLFLTKFIVLLTTAFSLVGISRKVVTASAFSSASLSSSRSFRSTATATTTTATATRTSQRLLAMSATPPVPRREEDRVLYAGVAPSGWDTSVPRQSRDSKEALLDPPVAVNDPYGWMRNDKRDNQEVLDHLKAENEYTQTSIQHLESLQKTLYNEFLSSIQETDYTTPRPRGDFWYYTRTFEGKSYKQHCRAPKTSDSFQIQWDGSKESPIMPGEEAYLDVNVLGKDKPYCSLGAMKPSPSQKFLAYTVDFKGDEIYQVYVRNLETGKDVPLKTINNDNDDDAAAAALLETSGNLVWGNDDSTLFYMTMDANHRPDKLFQRQNWQSSSAAKEILLKEEPDDMYWSHVYKSLDGKYVFFETASKETSEVWFLPLEEEEKGGGGEEEMQCVAPRRNKVLYEVEHGHGNWYIWTNVDGTPNMKLMQAAAKANCAEDWELVVDANDKPIFDGSLEKALESVTVLDSHVVVEGRQDGIPRVWIYDPPQKILQRLEFEEPAHDVGLSTHYEFKTTKIAVGYDSLVTPPQTIEISLEGPQNERTVLKEKNVPGYSKDLYGCDRQTVLSRDGSTDIPISIVYRKDVMEKAKAGEKVPIHLYGYGSYGSCCEADFDSTRLPLLERGMIYVIAHIRGGGEMGRQWYEEPNGAKFLCKKNTFNDFVDIARFLVNEWTTPALLSCEGRSAGGMLIGSSINQAPELFRCAILGVPFVDVVGTMMDASIPLTAAEWVEWGNPNEEKYFQYMMDYNPMTNVENGVKYPSCWLTGGLHDPRVAFWEPAKFAATLRNANPDGDNIICLKMDMSAGHFSASDRYKYLKELAIDYSFLLDQLGLVNEEGK